MLRTCQGIRNLGLWRFLFAEDLRTCPMFWPPEVVFSGPLKEVAHAGPGCRLLWRAPGNLPLLGLWRLIACSRRPIEPTQNPRKFFFLARLFDHQTQKRDGDLFVKQRRSVRVPNSSQGPLLSDEPKRCARCHFPHSGSYSKSLTSKPAISYVFAVSACDTW